MSNYAILIKENLNLIRFFKKKKIIQNLSNIIASYEYQRTLKTPIKSRNNKFGNYENAGREVLERIEGATEIKADMEATRSKDRIRQ